MNVDALRAAAVAGQGIIYQATFIVADDLRAAPLFPSISTSRLMNSAAYTPFISGSQSIGEAARVYRLFGSRG